METRATYRPTEPRTERPVGDLIGDLRDETFTLFQQEIALFKAEMSEKISRYARNAIILAAGGMVAYTGLIFLLLAASLNIQSALLQSGVSAIAAIWAGPGLVGLLVALIGLGLVLKARKTLSKESLTPSKTIETLKEDTAWTLHKIKDR